MLTVCQITSVHRRYDVRILDKISVSLQEHGYQVFLVVADNQPDEIYKGVKIVSANFSAKNRIHRFLFSGKKIFKKAKEINADIYHFHDPELIPVGVKLAKLGKTVIYDSHEDYISTLQVKSYIPRFLRKTFTHFFEKYEKNACRYFKGLSLCYHWTYDRLQPICPNAELIFNFPILPENISSLIPNYFNRTIAYTGGISAQWHIVNAIEAIEEIKDLTFILASNQAESQYLSQLRSLKGWKKVNFLGAVKHQLLYEKVFSQTTVGIALLDYIPQCKGHVGNLSNTKLFEYLLMGLPVVCTDFDLWKEIIENENCGICVNPYHVEEVKQAIIQLVSNPELARKMGQNGQKAVIEKYNWKTEERKLLNLYANVLNK